MITLWDPLHICFEIIKTIHLMYCLYCLAISSLLTRLSQSNQSKSDIFIDIKVTKDYIKHYKQLLYHSAVVFLIMECHFLGYETILNVLLPFIQIYKHLLHDLFQTHHPLLFVSLLLHLGELQDNIFSW